MLVHKSEDFLFHIVRNVQHIDSFVKCATEILRNADDGPCHALGFTLGFTLGLAIGQTLVIRVLSDLQAPAGEMLNFHQ